MGVQLHAFPDLGSGEHSPTSRYPSSGTYVSDRTFLRLSCEPELSFSFADSDLIREWSLSSQQTASKSCAYQFVLYLHEEELLDAKSTCSLNYIWTSRYLKCQTFLRSFLQSPFVSCVSQFSNPFPLSGFTPQPVRKSKIWAPLSWMGPKRLQDDTSWDFRWGTEIIVLHKRKAKIRSFFKEYVNHEHQQRKLNFPFLGVLFNLWW